MSSGFPEISDSFLKGQSLLYSQFNDIEFYIEDKDQENLYFYIFKKLFPSIAFEKIFPLNGKKNVVEQARLNRGNRKKIFIVDLDFDHLLNNIINLDNLFYLDKYSIENYLYEKQAVFDFIKEEKVKLHDADIEAVYNHHRTLKDCAAIFRDLCARLFVIRKLSLGISYYAVIPGRDIDFSKLTLKGTDYLSFCGSVETELKARDKRYTMMGQIRKYRKHFEVLDNVPGKCIISVLKYILSGAFHIRQIHNDSFVVRLAKNSTFTSLTGLRQDVTDYIGPIHQ